MIIILLYFALTTVNYAASDYVVSSQVKYLNEDTFNATSTFEPETFEINTSDITIAFRISLIQDDDGNMN